MERQSKMTYLWVMQNQICSLFFYHPSHIASWLYHSLLGDVTVFAASHSVFWLHVWLLELVLPTHCISRKGRVCIHFHCNSEHGRIG